MYVFIYAFLFFNSSSFILLLFFLDRTGEHLLFINPIVLFHTVNCYVCSINNGQLKLEDIVLTKSILENTKCFLLDCGAELFVWVGRVTQVEDRKTASAAVEVKPRTQIAWFVALLKNVSLYKNYLL